MALLVQDTKKQDMSSIIQNKNYSLNLATGLIWLEHPGAR